MKRLRPRTTVIGGAAIGLIAGAAVYGAISTAAVATSIPVSFRPAAVKVAPAPAGHATPASCAAGEKLVSGVCVVHVQKVVVRPAPASIQAEASTGGTNGSPDGSGPSSSNGSAPSGKRAAATGSYRETESERATKTAVSAPASAEHEAEAAPDVAEHAAEADG